MQGGGPVGELVGAADETAGAVLEVAGPGDQVAGAVVQLGGAVGELRGAVRGVDDAVMDGREAHVDVVEVLLEHAPAQRVRQRGADGLGEVAAHVVDGVVGGDGQQSRGGLGGVLGIPAQARDVLGEVGGDLHRRSVGAVLEAPMRFLRGDLNEVEDVLLVDVQQCVRELSAHVQMGLVAAGRCHRRALVLIDHRGGDLVQGVRGITEGPRHVPGVDQRDQREADDEQCRDRLLPLPGQQRDSPASGRGGAASEGAGGGGDRGDDGVDRGRQCGRQGGQERSEESHHEQHDTFVYRVLLHLASKCGVENVQTLCMAW